MEISEIINRCQLGDMDAFEELYHMHAPKAKGMAYLIAGNKGIAEDIVQEAFIACFRHIGQLKNPETFNVWLYRTLVRSGWRMASKHKGNAEFMDYQSIDPAAAPDGAAQSFTDSSNERMMVREAVNRLKTPLKTVVILYYYNEMSVKDISRVLGCMQGTVKSRLHTARKLLKKELEIYEDNKEGAAGKWLTNLIQS